MASKLSASLRHLRVPYTYVDEGICAFRFGDVVNSILVKSKVLGELKEMGTEVNGYPTVSLNGPPSPVFNGAIRSIKKVTRNKLTFS